MHICGIWKDGTEEPVCRASLERWAQRAPEMRAGLLPAPLQDSAVPSVSQYVGAKRCPALSDPQLTLPLRPGCPPLRQRAAH